MAAKSFLSIVSLLTIFFFSSCTDVVVSRSLVEEKALETATFDVSASIQKTIDVLNFKPQTLTTQFVQSPSGSSFSVPLLSRSAVETNVYKTYEDLTKARLERHTKRVKSISFELDRKLNNVKKSKLGSPFETEDLQAPVTSGASLGEGAYFCRVGVGSPAKPLYLNIDTGSDISWVQCKPCSNCYNQTDPIFDPSASSSYAPLACGSTACQALRPSSCQVGKCQYLAGYGDQSATTGEFATETITFGTSGSVPKVPLGCARDHIGNFKGSAGLLGLGGGALSLPSHIKATSFSYCLVDRDSSSSSTLEFSTPRPADSITTPIIKNPKIDTFFYVGLVGIDVGGTMLPIPQSLFEIDNSGEGGVIVDSGTTLTLLQPEAYTILRDAFRRNVHVQNLQPAEAYDNEFVTLETCYNLSGETRLTFPTISFHFAGGGKLTLPQNNVLFAVGSGAVHCLAFGTSPSSLSIIGNIQQQSTRVSYDLRNSIVGFSQGKC